MFSCGVVHAQAEYKTLSIRQNVDTAIIQYIENQGFSRMHAGTFQTDIFCTRCTCALACDVQVEQRIGIDSW
jgi:hypothetical protein